ncbi:IS5/IS1182 family transposase [Actinosynnema pretiosum subsp. pretiosum]|uniref:IS5/IS1182 family transposase n=1 Tax=Actinosynnema pretiosum subsp. pretiosum TaxID=103721 RepID=A0AA45LE82_9PSEU|nr:IS5/IS1182 family transposase [Actinosynnema pretiosum subsp. pretiosum]
MALLLKAERARRGTRAGTRALTCFHQAVLGLRWLRDHTAPARLARDHRVSRAIAYRYLDEVLQVLAGQAPDLASALAHAKKRGAAHVVLDGKLFHTDRHHGESGLNRHRRVIDAWCSGKTRCHGGVITAVTMPNGPPIWVSPMEPGRVHDLVAARRHALPALARAATELGLPALADQGYLNAGHGVITPNRTPRERWAEPELTVDQKTCDLLLRALRGCGERGFALLVGRWKALRHTTASPRKLTRIVAAALACTHYEHHWNTDPAPR